MTARLSETSNDDCRNHQRPGRTPDWGDRTDDDIVIEQDNAVVLVDSASQPFLAGSQVDFVDDLIGASFRVNNPNATASCGCGTSFSV